MGAVSCQHDNVSEVVTQNLGFEDGTDLEGHCDDCGQTVYGRGLFQSDEPVDGWETY